MLIDAKDLDSLTVSDRVDVLVKLAKATYRDDNIRGKIAIGQAILESSILKPKISGLALHNNLFGIKGAGTKGITTKRTIEYNSAGVPYETDAEFATNHSLLDSFEQHKKLLLRPRYKRVMEATTLKEACEQLYNCGYATDVNYATKLYQVLKQPFITPGE